MGGKKKVTWWSAYGVMGLSIWSLITFSDLIRLAVTAANNETLSFSKPVVNSSKSSRLEKCENGTLNECFKQLPPFPDQGIPSSLTGVTKACKSFNTGMSCVKEWTKSCLTEEAQRKIMDSVRGARETFTFLCHDGKFQSEFLQHAGCYKQISNYWDDCANRFINTLKALNPALYDDITNLCCVRLSYMKCVSEASYYHCEKSAAQFLQKMAETLVRSQLRGNAPQAQHCDNEAIATECERRNYAASTASTLIMSILLPPHLFPLSLSSFLLLRLPSFITTINTN